LLITLSVFVTAAFVFGGIELVANNTTLAGGGIKPRLLTYIDKQCRPLRCVVIQPLFCWLDYIGEAAATATIFTAINDGQPEL
jgi:amino acid permease